MPFFVDRDNQPISRQRWQELSRQVDYGLLSRHTGPGWEVEASWLGWCSDCERPCKPFLVQVLSDQIEPGLGRRKGLDGFADVWCRTPEEARDLAQKIVLDLCRKEEGPVFICPGAKS